MLGSAIFVGIIALHGDNDDALFEPVDLSPANCSRNGSPPSVTSEGGWTIDH